MLSEISGSYEGLSGEQRSSLADLIEVRNEYNQALIILNQMRIEVLRNYTEEGEARLTDFSAAIVSPIRIRVSTQLVGIMKDVVDVEGLKGMMPMVVMALLGNINLPLVLNAIGLEPDTIEELINLTKDFFKQGM